MPIAKLLADDWQKLLPPLVAIGVVAWLIVFREEPDSERALFAALLIIYMLHQIEEHLWPGGFREFANAHVFRSGRDDWPVGRGGVAIVNIGMVWLPVALAVIWPVALRWLGLALVALTLVNALTHIVTSIRFRSYNPGLVTSIVLFLPFTIWVLADEAGGGQLSGPAIAWLMLAGVLLHLPVAALFVVPYRFSKPAR